MKLFLEAFALFSFGYLVNIFYITVLYHRGLTHSSVILKDIGTDQLSAA